MGLERAESRLCPCPSIAKKVQKDPTYLEDLVERLRWSGGFAGAEKPILIGGMNLKTHAEYLAGRGLCAWHPARFPRVLVPTELHVTDANYAVDLSFGDELIALQVWVPRWVPQIQDACTYAQLSVDREDWLLQQAGYASFANTVDAAYRLGGVEAVAAFLVSLDSGLI